MKIHALRSVSALGLAALLAACGGGQVDQPVQTATAMQSGSSAQVSARVSTQGAAQAGAQNVAQVAANMPAPDCAADGCKGLRIIDANAEAYRYQAMRRAAADGTST